MTDNERKLKAFAIDAIALSERKRLYMKNINILSYDVKDDTITSLFQRYL